MAEDMEDGMNFDDIFEEGEVPLDRTSKGIGTPIKLGEDTGLEGLYLGEEEVPNIEPPLTKIYAAVLGGSVQEDLASLREAGVDQIANLVGGGLYLQPNMSSNTPIGPNVQRFLEDPTREDVLLESIRNDEPVATILNQVLEEIAEEACYLKAFRKDNSGPGMDFSDVSAKRIKMLKSLVESLVEKEKIKNSKDTGKIDFHSKNFENIFAHFLNVVKETFEKVSVPKQYEDIFFTQLAKDLDGFERAAEKIYYGKK